MKNLNIKNINNVGGVLFIVLAIIVEFTQNPSSNKYNNSNTSACGYGDRSCIEDIRVRFTNTGKDIVGEQYTGDGIFEIQFIEYGKGTFNASVIVDCECNLLSSTKVTRL